MTTHVQLKSKSLTTGRLVLIAEVRSLAKSKGGYREKRAKVASINLCDGSTNTADAWDANGNFLFSFALEDDGIDLDICG